MEFNFTLVTQNFLGFLVFVSLAWGLMGLIGYTIVRFHIAPRLIRLGVIPPSLGSCLSAGLFILLECIIIVQTGIVYSVDDLNSDDIAKIRRSKYFLVKEQRTMANKSTVVMPFGTRMYVQVDDKADFDLIAVDCDDRSKVDEGENVLQKVISNGEVSVVFQYWLR